MGRLSRSFFERKTELVARDLLGKFLVREIGGKKLSGIIVETEAYVGPHDLACHAAKGKTERTQVMFEEAGCWYVYLIYGFYHCLNIVTEAKGYPSAVLIRALEPVEEVREMKRRRKTKELKNLTSGPGKLCLALGIEKNLNASLAVSRKAKLYIEDRGFQVSKKDVVAARRIGVDYAGIWKNKLLRFYLRNNSFVSKLK